MAALWAALAQSGSFANGLIGFSYFCLHDSGSSAADRRNVFSDCTARGSGDT